MTLVTVNDQELETFGRFKLQCAFDGENFEHNFVITGGIIEECIVRMNAINDQGMIIDGADRSVSFKSTFGSRQFFYPSGSLSNVPEEQMEQIWPMVTTERLAIPAKSGIVTHCKALHFVN